MTLEQFKENARLGIITEETHIEAIMKAFAALPLKDLYHHSMRSEDFMEKDIVTEIFDSIQTMPKNGETYQYSELVSEIYSEILHNCVEEDNKLPDYTGIALAMEDIALLANRIVPGYRKRKGD